MVIIPVVDIRNGQVVHAHRGKRDHYQPLQSRLCRSSQPLEVIAALLDLYPFTTLYLADLNAIERSGDNLQLIARLAEKFHSVAFWVDAGISNLATLRRWQALGHLQPVLGSESQADVATLESLLHWAHPVPIILSLDFMHDRFLGPPELLHRPELWPDQVIVMSLDHVGGTEGPDLRRNEAIRRLAPGKYIFAAGGIRNLADLASLVKLGVTGTLLASALHDGRIEFEDIVASSKNLPRIAPGQAHHPWSKLSAGPKPRN